MSADSHRDEGRHGQRSQHAESVSPGEPVRAWHLTGVAQASLLGTANLVFWQIFIAAEALVMGYVTTSLHWIFAVAQLFAAIAASEPTAVRRGVATSA